MRTFLKTAVILILLLGGGFWWLYEHYLYVFDNKNFDRITWLDAQNLTPEDDLNGKASPRILMVDDIIKRHVYEGISKEKVFELLGKPTGGSDAMSSYYLGGSGSDVCALHVYFGPNGVVLFAKKSCGG